MKRLTLLSIIFVLLLAGCKEDNRNVLKVGATPVPHAEILNFVKEDLKKAGIELEVVEFTDYVVPNLALNDGQIDANFFQHIPYLESFSKERGVKLVNYEGIHIEPLGLYSKEYNSIDQIKDGDTIAFPNDTVNGARALKLLEREGIIELDPAAGDKANERDIIKNPKNLDFKALEAAQLPRVLQDVDLAVINGNYALEAGLNPIKDSLILEGSESPYVNIITIREGEESDPRFKKLVEAIKTEKVKEFIIKNYSGGVVPVF